MKKILHTILLVATLVAANSCGNTKNITYFQDSADGKKNTVAKEEFVTIKPGDKLSIIVNTRDPQLTSLFNLPYTTRTIGMGESTSASSQGIAGYIVDNNGDIDFPVIGNIRIGGLTRVEAVNTIKNELKTRNLVNDPIVTIDFMNLTVSVMGEVGHPGLVNIDRDSYTIINALSAAGDLTIYGNRTNVKVMRTTGGETVTYSLNLNSAEKTLASPAYFLQQNDIVYVEPNTVKARQSTANGNNFLNVSFWISVASFGITLLLMLKQFGVFK